MARQAGDAVTDNRDHTTRDALLHYLRVDDQPCALYAIEKYLFVMFKVKHSATREQIYRLCRAGLVERTAPRWYRAI